MRTSTTLASIVAAALLWAGCGNKNDAAEEAKREAAELDMKAGTPKPAAKMRAPVANEAHIPCEQLIPDLTKFQTVLGETEPLALSDVTKGDAEAAASCGIIKGGAKLDANQQAALAKKTNHRLGVLPGDEICRVTAYCWTVENEENFKARCKQRGPGFKEDTSMGNYACVQVVAQGADDVNVYSFYDEDTKCILKVGGGPSNTNNDNILACANTARDMVGPDQIKVDAPPPPAP